MKNKKTFWSLIIALAVVDTQHPLNICLKLLSSTQSEYFVLVLFCVAVYYDYYCFLDLD